MLSERLRLIARYDRAISLRSLRSRRLLYWSWRSYTPFTHLMRLGSHQRVPFSFVRTNLRHCIWNPDVLTRELLEFQCKYAYLAYIFALYTLWFLDETNRWPHTCQTCHSHWGAQRLWRRHRFSFSKSTDNAQHYHFRGPTWRDLPIHHQKLVSRSKRRQLALSIHDNYRWHLWGKSSSTPFQQIPWLYANRLTLESPLVKNSKLVPNERARVSLYLKYHPVQ